MDWCMCPRQAQPEAQRRARLGAFEIILSWQSAGGGSRQQIVLFSKLNTLRFPNPPELVNPEPSGRSRWTTNP